MAAKNSIPASAPYYPVRLTSEIVYAVKAIAAGEANKHQQGAFLEWLIVEVCKKDDLSFRPGGDEGRRDSDMAEGKRFVALSVVKALNMPPDKVAELRAAEDAARGLPVTEGDEIGRRD